MNTPLRIAVVVLATLIGAALSHLIGLHLALPAGFVVGLIVAQVLPGKSCALPQKKEPGSSLEREDAE